MARPAENVYDTIEKLLAAYEHAVEVEADERLYVQPPLSFHDLMVLQVTSLYERKFGGPPTRKALGELMVSPQVKIRESCDRCEGGGFLQKGKVTSIGLVAARVVQYVHHDWVEKVRPVLIGSVSEDCAARLSHPDAERLMPRLYMVLRDELRDLEREFTVAVGGSHGVELSQAMLVVMMDDYYEIEERWPDAAALAELLGVERRIPYERLSRLRLGKGTGHVTAIDAELTKRGRELARSTRACVEAWSVMRLAQTLRSLAS